MTFSLQETLKGVAKKMMVDFETKSKQLEHKGLVGRVREIAVVNEFLADHLPKQLGIATGEIVSSEGSVSKQMDIIIFDSFKSPILLKENEIHILPVESVYAIIEVKSNLNQTELKDTIEKVLSVKSMQKKSYIEQKGPIIGGTNLFGKEYPYFPTIGLCFAYDSMDLIKVGKLLAQINRARGIPLAHRVDTICVLNKGVIANSGAQGKISITPEPNSKIVSIPTDDSLLLFYLLLMGVLNQTWMRPLQLAEYAKSLRFGNVYACE